MGSTSRDVQDEKFTTLPEGNSTGKFVVHDPKQLDGTKISSDRMEMFKMKKLTTLPESNATGKFVARDPKQLDGTKISSDRMDRFQYSKQEINSFKTYSSVEDYVNSSKKDGKKVKLV